MVYLGVIGAGKCDEQTAAAAYEVGRETALGGATLICGGRGGVMKAACRGCKDYGGVSIGILPGFKRQEANPYVSYVLTTGLGALRNFLVVRCSDALIALPGEYGTLSEMAIALKEGKKVFALFPSLMPSTGQQSCEKFQEQVQGANRLPGRPAGKEQTRKRAGPQSRKQQQGLLQLPAKQQRRDFSRPPAKQQVLNSPLRPPGQPPGLPLQPDHWLEQFLQWPGLEVVFSPQEAVRQALSFCRDPGTSVW